MAASKRKRVMGPSELKFYDLRTKKTFTSCDYDIREVNGRRFAIAVSPEGNESWRVLPKEAY